MGRVIQMIFVPPEGYFFLTGITEAGEIIFRSSRNIEHLQCEKPVIENGMVFTNLYHFPVGYLQNFIRENGP